jgi:hypothetical protein
LEIGAPSFVCHSERSAAESKNLRFVILTKDGAKPASRRLSRAGDDRNTDSEVQ